MRTVESNNGSRCLLSGLLTRQYLTLAAFNLLLIYMLFEAHTQVKQSKQRLVFLESFKVLKITKAGESQQIQREADTEMFDGIPLSRHMLNVLEVNQFATTTHSPALRPTTPQDLSKPINCSKLIKGDRAEISRVNNVQHSIHDPYQIRLAKDFIELTQNCSRFITTMGYRTKPLSKEEQEYPLAFGMRMHWKVDLAERLLRAIYHPQNVYCISVDRKSSHDLRAAMQGIADCLPNVFLASPTEVYMYGSWTAVWGDLKCMREARATGVQWWYYMNLAGQEYPLKTNLELVRMLKVLNGTNDIESYPLPKEFRHRVDFHHHWKNGIWLADYNSPKKPFTQSKIALRKGCSYNTFSRAFVLWLLEDPLPQAFIQWSKDTDSPDELVWASLNALPAAPGGYPMYITQISKTFLSREIVWQWGAGYCQGKLIRHICTFSFRDLPWLLRRWEFFANKFDTAYDHVVLDCIDQELRRRESQADPDHSIDWARINNLPHILYGSKRAKSIKDLSKTENKINR